MEFRILGPIEVHGEDPLPVRGSRRVGLLARLLLDANHSVPVDVLVEDLWADDATTGTRATLQSHVSQLRRVLGPERITHSSGGYVLHADEHEIDAAQFESDLHRAREELSQGEPAAANETLDETLGRWRGAALADVAERPWAAAEAARLDELRESAIELRLEARLAMHHHEQVVPAAETAVRDQPLRERRWELLMLALARSGRQADALEAYARLRTHLSEELGIEPSRTLVDLQRAILQQREVADAGISPGGGVARRASPASRAPRSSPGPTPDPLSGPGPSLGSASDTPAGQDPEPGSSSDLATAHRALAAGDWAAACAALSAADQDVQLETSDLEALAEAAMYCGQQELSIDARRRAFAQHLATGSQGQAAMDALWLTINHVLRVRFAVAAGWLRKAERLLAGADDEAATGFAEVVSALFAFATGDLDEARSRGGAAFDAGARSGDADLEAMGLMLQGAALVRLGEVADGMPLLDEAMATASSGGLGPFATGLIYCRTLCACIDLHDFQRAGEWLATARSQVEHADAGFPGDCRVHQAHLLLVTGDWEAAEREALGACTQAQDFDIRHSGMAWRELGAIRLRRGDLDGARDALGRARALAVSPEPEHARLLLAEGNVEAARAAIDEALAGAVEPLERADLLPAAVEIRLAADDVEPASDGAQELAELAATYESTALSAAAAEVDGRCRAARGAGGAATRLREAVAAWQQIHAPYRGARARLALARLLAREGQRGEALAEARTARETFAVLRAGPDHRRADAVISSLDGAVA